MHIKLNKFCEKLDYIFNNIEFLETALSHRSSDENHNERLEFLGDSLLNFIIAEKLFHMFPGATEGELSRSRASLVNKDTLANMARELEISAYLRLGMAEIKSGGAKRESILADTLEAIMGAIYLDSGMDKCREKILQWYAPRLANIIAIPVKKDPKTELQEYFQARQLPLPSYSVIETSGKAHAQIFKIKCTVEGLDYIAYGKGSSQRVAQQLAAQQFLSKIYE